MKLGKILAISAIILLIAYCIVIGLVEKYRKSDKNSGQIEKTVRRITDVYQPEGPTVSISKSLKADEWSEWIPIMWRRVAILPNDDGVVYEFRDDSGNVKSMTSEELHKKYEQDRNGRRNLNDDSMELRFKAKTPVKYIAGRW